MSNYYHFLDSENKKGFTQFLITTNLMINFIMEMIDNDSNIEISKIELYSEDNNFSEDIRKKFNLYKKGEIDKEIIYQYLKTIANNFSIDIVMVTFKKINLGKCSIMSNGLIKLMDSTWITPVLSSMGKAWNR